MGDDCCRTCERWAERPADPVAREVLEAPQGLGLRLRRTGEVFEISAARPTIVVGRVPGNDIVVPDANVSRRQMQFLFADGAIYAEDLGSACGTFIDGNKISSRVRLGRGALVSFADHDVELVELVELAPPGAP